MDKLRLTLFGIIIVSGTIVATLLYFAVPVWYFDYNTGLDLPNFLSEEEAQRYMEQRNQILNMENKGRNGSLIYNDIGILRSGYGDYKGAIRAFRIAKKRNPEDARFSRNMAISYTSLGELNKAESAFKEAFRLAPTQPVYWLELGELYTYKIQDNNKARLFYLEAINRSNEHLDVIKKYANFLENVEKDYAGAIKYWRILLERDENNRGIYEVKISELQDLLEDNEKNN